MDLVERYVHAVRRHLPSALQDDIANELTDDILSQIRDREADLGRSLNDAEQEAVLKHYGHPFLLAVSYRPQRHLIGPATFPFYWPTLKLAVALAFLVHVVLAFTVSFGEDAPHRVLPRIIGFPGIAIRTFAWVTLFFAALDYWQGRLRLFDNWSPRSLPAPAKPPVAVQRAGVIGEVVASVLFIAWWLAIPRYPFLVLGPGAAFIALSPAWDRVHLMVLVPAAASMLVAVLVLIRPSWTLLAKGRRLFGHGMTLVTVSLLLKAGNLLMPATDRPDLARMVDVINQGVVFALLITSIVAVVQGVLEVIRLARDYRG